MSSKPQRRIIGGCLFIGILCTLLLIMIAPQIKDIYRMGAEQHRLEQVKAELEKENRELKARLKDMDSVATVEKIAREQLGMVKKGERTIIPLQEEKP